MKREEKFMSDIKKSSLELVGHTPLLEVSRYSKQVGVTKAAILAEKKKAAECLFLHSVM